MKKNFFTVALATISLSVFVSSCNNEQKEFPVDESQETQTYDLERLTFKSSQDLVSVIQSGNQSNTTDFIETRGLHFKSLLSTISDKATRSSSTTYYEALGYDTLVPNRSFAALLNPQGEVEVMIRFIGSIKMELIFSQRKMKQNLMQYTTLTL